jgi:hypothetical protein
MVMSKGKDAAQRKLGWDAFRKMKMCLSRYPRMIAECQKQYENCEESCKQISKDVFLDEDEIF